MQELVIRIFSFGSIVLTLLFFIFFVSLFTKRSKFFSELFQKHGLPVVFVFSLFSAVSSLIMSFAFDFPPCDLCWYQRAFMYPIVFISGMAIWRKDYKNGSAYVIMLASVGFAFAVYQYLLQMTQVLKSGPNICSPFSAADCGVPDFIEFGFVTTPYLSLVVFALILISAFYANRKN